MNGYSGQKFYTEGGIQFYNICFTTWPILFLGCFDRELLADNMIRASIKMMLIDGFFHADPHPGNFLVSPEGELIAIDFGCIKHVPESFYVPYFELAEKNNINDTAIFKENLFATT